MHIPSRSIRLIVATALAAFAFAAPSARAFAETPEETAADCEARFEFAPGGCRCIIEDWAKFSDDERAYLGAMAKGDSDTAATLEATFTEQQKLHTGFFMATISSKLAC